MRILKTLLLLALALQHPACGNNHNSNAPKPLEGNGLANYTEDFPPAELTSKINSDLTKLASVLANSIKLTNNLDYEQIISEGRDLAEGEFRSKQLFHMAKLSALRTISRPLQDAVYSYANAKEKSEEVREYAKRGLIPLIVTFKMNLENVIFPRGKYLPTITEDFAEDLMKSIDEFDALLIYRVAA